MTQIGYGLGLLFVVPLGDRIENRRLVVVAVLRRGRGADGDVDGGRERMFSCSAPSRLAAWRRRRCRCCSPTRRI